MDVYPRILQFPIPALRHDLSYGCPVLSGIYDTKSLGKTIQTARTTQPAGLCVSEESGSEIARLMLCRSKVLPAAVSTGGDIGLSNMSLKIITLSLYSESR